MGFVLGASLIALIVGAAVGSAIGMALQKLSGPMKRRIFPLLLAISLLPLILHAYFTYRYAVGYTDLQLSDDPIGSYSGATSFATISAILILVVLVAALFALGRWPLSAALVPPILFAGYYNLAMPALQQGAPGGGIVIDNMPTIWLFFFSVLATSMLFLMAHFGFEQNGAAR